MNLVIPLKTKNVDILDESNILNSKDVKNDECSIIITKNNNNNEKAKKQYLKNNKNRKASLGFEYDSDINTDKDFCEKIFKSNLYAPTSQKLIDYYTDISKLLELTEFKDTRNIGTIIGMAVLGVVGFLAFSFTIVGGIAGGIIGIALGRYAGKKITRRIKRKKPLTNEELFKTKLECLIKWGEMQSQELKLNLNEYRMIIEKIVEEFQPALDIDVFQKPITVKNILFKLKTFLMRAYNQRAILLSYKLFKAYLKMVDLDKANIQLEIANKIYFFFMTYQAIIEMKSEKDSKSKKNIKYLVSYQKIAKLIQSELMQEILKIHPNVARSQEHLDQFRELLKQHVDLNKNMIDFATENKQLILQSLDAMKSSVLIKDDKIMSNENNITKHNHKGDNNSNSNKKYASDIYLDDKLDVEENADKKNIYVSIEAKNFNTGMDLHNIKSSVMDKVQRISNKIKKYTPSKAQKVNNSRKLSGESSEVSSLGYQEDDNELINDFALYRPPKINSPNYNISNNKDMLDILKSKKGEAPLNDLSIGLSKDDPSSNDNGDGAGAQRKPENEFKIHITKANDGIVEEQQNEVPSLTQKILEQNPKTHNFLEIHDNLQNFDSCTSNNNHNHNQYSLKEMDFSPHHIINTEKSLQKIELHNEKGVDLVKMPSDPNLLTSQELNLAKLHEKSHDDMEDSKTNELDDCIKKKVSGFGQNSTNILEREVIFKKILAIDSDSFGKWEKVMDNPIMKIQKIKPEDSPVVLIRAVANLNGLKPKEIYDVIYDSAYRSKWDTVINNFRVVEKIDQHTDIIYFLIKAPFGVSNRDFVQVRCYQLDYPRKEEIIISFQSTIHPSVPPIKGNIRGDTITSGYIIRPHPKDPKNSAQLVIINQVDIKGSIPKTIVNHVASKAPLEWVNKLMKAARERSKK